MNNEFVATVEHEHDGLQQATRVSKPSLSCRAGESSSSSSTQIGQDAARTESSAAIPCLRAVS